MVAMSARMVVVMVAPVASAPTSAVAVAGGPRWGTSRPSALGWRCTQGPSGPALRHQRVAKADTWGTLAAKGIIIWEQGRMSRGFSRWLRSTAESQLRHRVAVRGPSQKAGGFVGACSYKKKDGRLLVSACSVWPLPEGRLGNASFPLPGLGSGAGVRDGMLQSLTVGAGFRWREG